MSINSENNIHKVKNIKFEKKKKKKKREWWGDEHNQRMLRPLILNHVLNIF